MPRLASHFGLQDPRFQSVVSDDPSADDFGRGNVTSPQLLSGFIIYNGAGAANRTLPSASELCNNIQGCMVSTSFEFELRNIGAGTATLAAGPA